MKSSNILLFLLPLTLPFLSFAQTGRPTKELDGQIWLTQKDAPPPIVYNDSDYLGPNGVGAAWFRVLSPKATATTLYQRDLAKWKDPLTLPQSRAECAKWAIIHIPLDGDVKTCVGWTTQFKWMYNTLKVRVTTADSADIGKALDDCLSTAAVAGALAGVISGGHAAVPTFETALKACLILKLPSLTSVTVWIDSAWGGWE
jgi:hypothetical protein